MLLHNEIFNLIYFKNANLWAELTEKAHTCFDML